MGYCEDKSQVFEKHLELFKEIFPIKDCGKMCISQCPQMSEKGLFSLA
jgi:hypothetical protein